MKNEKDTTLTTITSGSKYFSYVRSQAPSHTQTLNNLFETLQIKWEENIFIKKSSCVFITACVVYYCVCLIIVVLLWYGIWEYNIWFAQLESYFVVNNVMEQRQLPILFSAFPASLTPVVKDLITETTLNSTYDSIKREVLLRTSSSAEKQFQTLVNDELLVDRKPSELLRRMRELVGVPAHSAFIKQLFLLRLLPQVKAILALMADKSSVDIIASSADKVMEFTKVPITASILLPKAEVFTLSAVGNISQEATHVAILDILERLTQEIRKLAVVKSQTPRHRYKSRSPSPHHRRHSNKLGLCFYHSHFGAETQRCKMLCSFFKPGKLKSGELSMAHTPQDLCNNRAYFIPDSRSQAHCLVDTGTACSIWPLKLLTEKPPVSPITLQALNHSPIPTYSQISRSLDLELQRDFTWVFTVADLAYPILGSDFLHYFNLLVDMCKRRLIDANTKLSVMGFKANTSPISPVFFIAATDDPYQTLLRSYPELKNLSGLRVMSCWVCWLAQNQIQIFSLRGVRTPPPPCR